MRPISFVFISIAVFGFISFTIGKEISPLLARSS